MPLLNFNLGATARAQYERLAGSADDDEDSVLDIDEGQDDGPSEKRKRWWNYIPLSMLVALMFVPQYFILAMLVSYYLKIHYAPLLFTVHASFIFLFTFLACCSLLVCVVRDPGAIRVGEDGSSGRNTQEESEDENEETDMLDALRMAPSSKSKKSAPEGLDDDFNAPHKWCKKCWAPKPERSHHCSACRRCVLKMDHHCPWLAQKCVGHWTYTAFLHFLFSITLLSTYLFLVAGRIVYVAFLNPFLVDEQTAIKALFLSIYGVIFALVVGSFLSWHLYLASTNQTTIENISPFLLLRYIPYMPSTSSYARVATPSSPSTGSVNLNSPFRSPLPLHPTSHLSPSTPPSSSLTSVPNPGPQAVSHNGPGPNAMFMTREHQLSAAQRRHVRLAHGSIRLYDVGFRANWAQLIGVRKHGWRGWAYRFLCGGGGTGDGKNFPRNPKAESQLARLAAALASEDKMD